MVKMRPDVHNICYSFFQDGDVPTLRLRLKKPKSDKKVQWTTETIDNEDMNKKKSKCKLYKRKIKIFKRNLFNKKSKSP